MAAKKTTSSKKMDKKGRKPAKSLPKAGTKRKSAKR